jgi:hypothetical protein
MDIFCEFLDDQLYLHIGENSIQIDVPNSFYEDEENNEFKEVINQTYEFSKRFGVTKFLSRNKLYIRTNRLKKIEHIEAFVDNILNSVSTKIFSSEHISITDLLAKKLPINKEILQSIHKDYLAQHTIPTKDKKKRRIIQITLIPIITVIALFLTINYKVTTDIHIETVHPKIFWNLWLAILLFNLGIQKILMKIKSHNEFYFTLLAIFLTLLISKGITITIIKYTNISYSFMWFQLTLQTLLWFLWNEKIAIHFTTRNKQIN